MMKFTLKLLLLLCVLLPGIFIATPLWLPWIFAQQLPAGFHLEKLQTGYPGTSGININALHVTGELKGAGLDIVAADIRFTYRRLKSEIDSLSLDVYLRTEDDEPDDQLTIDDLSLPVTRLTGKLPELSISQIQLTLHQAGDDPSGLRSTNQTVMLEFHALSLLPHADNTFKVSADVSMEGGSNLDGQVDIDVYPDSLQAELRFPAAHESPPWLEVSLKQKDQASQSTTQVQAMFDADEANRQWLNSLLALYTDSNIALVSGKLEARSNFAGKELQTIENLSLTVRNLQTELDGGMLDFDATLLARREGEHIAVTLPADAQMQYRDSTGKIDELITAVIPALKRTPQPNAVARIEVGAESDIIIKPTNDPSIEFNGIIKLDVQSATSSISLEAPDLELELLDLSQPDSAVVNGLVEIGWKEGSSFSYIIVEDGSDPMTLMADGIDIQAQLSSIDGKLFSTGGGSVSGGQIKPLGTSANKVDVSWQDLDLLDLSGNLSTRTQGFRSELDGEIWSGFDLDLDFTMLNGVDITGVGTVKFESGPDLPIEFSGNTLTEKWDIKLPASTIKLSQLGSMMNAAHFELPDSIKLTNGYIDIKGDIRSDTQADTELTASMMINGHELGGSMLESLVRNASFNFATSLDTTVSAKGPVSIETLALAGGIDISDVRTDLHVVNTDTFILKNLHAELFDGQLNLGRLHIADSRIEDSTAELTHINLGRLLAFADIDGLDGSGFLDISLPAGSDQTGIHIRNGTFSSSEPGHLAYTKEGVAGSNIGLQALENFQYQDLSGTVDYQSNGDYQISVRLEGKNPDLYGGHPIVFNLTINGSLPELFEALFITGSFEESILKEIRSR